MKTGPGLQAEICLDHRDACDDTLFTGDRFQTNDESGEDDNEEIVEDDENI